MEWNPQADPIHEAGAPQNNEDEEEKKQKNNLVKILGAFVTTMPPIKEDSEAEPGEHEQSVSEKRYNRAIKFLDQKGKQAGYDFVDKSVAWNPGMKLADTSVPLQAGIALPSASTAASSSSTAASSSSMAASSSSVAASSSSAATSSTRSTWVAQQAFSLHAILTDNEREKVLSESEGEGKPVLRQTRHIMI